LQTVHTFPTERGPHSLLGILSDSQPSHAKGGAGEGEKGGDGEGEKGGDGEGEKGGDGGSEQGGSGELLYLSTLTPASLSLFSLLLPSCTGSDQLVSSHSSRDALTLAYATMSHQHQCKLTCRHAREPTAAQITTKPSPKMRPLLIADTHDRRGNPYISMHNTSETPT